MKTYIFKVVVEPDEDRWFAHCPALEEEGAATWGVTQEEALKNLREVLEMVIESLMEHGAPIPEKLKEGVTISPEPLVAVTV